MTQQRRRAAPEEFPEDGRLALSLIILIAACTMLELALSADDYGLIGNRPGLLRREAYDYGAFWPGLLRDWPANYPGQPALMFVTHAFLHGGLSHLAMNMITLWSLGNGVIARVGQRRFLAIYAISALGGGIGFGLLAGTLTPMVGASGALFGLAGAIIAWATLDRRADRLGLGPVLKVLAYLVALNLVMWLVLAGHLAWHTHLGGFIAGALAAIWLDR